MKGSTLRFDAITAPEATFRFEDYWVRVVEVKPYARGSVVIYERVHKPGDRRKVALRTFQRRAESGHRFSLEYVAACVFLHDRSEPDCTARFAAWQARQFVDATKAATVAMQDFAAAVRAAGFEPEEVEPYRHAEAAGYTDISAWTHAPPDADAELRRVSQLYSRPRLTDGQRIFYSPPEID